MIATDLTKQGTLDANHKSIQQINLTGDIYYIYYIYIYHIYHIYYSTIPLKRILNLVGCQAKNLG